VFEICYRQPFCFFSGVRVSVGILQANNKEQNR